MGGSQSPELRQGGLHDPVAPFLVSTKIILALRWFNCFRMSLEKYAMMSKMLKGLATCIGNPTMKRHAIGAVIIRSW